MVTPFDLMFWAGIIVLILILGPSKIPSLARAVGEAVREWKRGLEGLPPSDTSKGVAQPAPQASGAATESMGGQQASEFVSGGKPAPAEAGSEVSEDHPIVKAAIKEGIDVKGKSLDEIADELAAKLKEKRKKSSSSSSTQSI